MTQRVTIECDACPKRYEGNPAIGYSPGGWIDLPRVGLHLHLCPECSRAIYAVIDQMKRASASPPAANADGQGAQTK